MGCRSVDKPKIKHRRGLWSPDEDQKLRNYVLKHGHGCWSSLPINAGLKRNGKSCRLRWINYLRPGLKKGTFSTEEEEKILALHQILGNKWSQIAHHLPGRTDNEIKNYYHSYLKKRIEKLHETTQTVNSSSSSSSKSSRTTRDSSFDSLEHIFEAGSLVDTDQSTQQAQKNFNVPKILFAEWFSLDHQYFGKDLQNCGSLRNTYENPSSTADFQDESMIALLLDDPTVGTEMYTKSNNSCSVHEDVYFPPFDQDQIFGRGLDYFPGEFSMSCDEMYI